MKLKLPLIAAFVAVLGMSAGLTACGGSGSDSSAAAPTVAAAGTTANVKYTGFLYSATATNTKGTQFDTGQFEFKVGGGTVIPGFDQAVTGMKIGEKKTVRIPAALAYGAAGSGTAIPPNADLVFDIELVSLR
jgi:FKBP-type peptidyl-prolyl cis-trans isomerase FkpA